MYMQIGTIYSIYLNLNKLRVKLFAIAFLSKY